MKKIFIFAICVIVLLFTASCSDQGATVSEEVPINDKTTSQLISDNEHFKATVSDLFEEDFVQGAIYVAVEIENKSADTEQWFYLEDVYIDGQKAQSGSGVPVTVLPEKSATGVFFISTAKNLEDVAEVEFVFVCKNNETMEELFRTEVVSVLA